MTSDQGAINFFDMIIERYGEEDYANVIELIINLCKQYALWFSQAHEAMFVCKF